MIKRLFGQKQIPILGALNQLLGGTIGWFTMFTFFFSAISAWNTPTLGYIRDVFPWLNIFSFIVLICSGMLFGMWIQHKYIQPSSVNYWRKMFYDNNPSLKRQIALEQIILNYVIKDDSERNNAKSILDKLDKE